MNKPSYEALEIIANACLGALARAGFDMAAMDNPGDAIDSLAKRAATPAPAVDRKAVVHTLPADAGGLNAARRALEKWLGTWADSIPAQAYHQLCAMQQEMMAAAAPRPTPPAEAREPDAPRAAPPEADRMAVAWRFWIDNPDSDFAPHWSLWSTDEGFRRLCEKQGFRAEYAHPPAAAAPPRRNEAEPARWLVSGPLLSFFANDRKAAEGLLEAAGVDRDDWTITDLTNPIAPPADEAGEEGV